MYCFLRSAEVQGSGSFRGKGGLGFRVQGLGFRAATTTRVSLDPDFVAERVTLEAVVDHMTLP